MNPIDLEAYFRGTPVHQAATGFTRTMRNRALLDDALERLLSKPDHVELVAVVFRIAMLESVGRADAQLFPLKALPLT